MSDDWKKSIPFTKHLNAYLGYKALVILIAALVGAHYLGWL